MRRKTVEELERESVSSLIKDFLKDEYIELKVKTLDLTENYEVGSSEIFCAFYEGDSKKAKAIRGLGHGVLDALHGSLLHHYSESYPSLKGITFEGFSVLPDWGTRTSSGSDAEVEVQIKFRNSLNNVIAFVNKGRSFVRCSVDALFEAIEFYINAEKCFKKLKLLIKDAKERNRSDMAQSYVSKISTIVRITSYEEID